ncbi:ComF family protein [Sphingomonas sp. Leaf412]|uniref:ComF family protein n=1 Tax=Sphingomonas sp. Leaf412 TaxID=1736370 RepID=UPI001F24C7E2|nr:ComF family protein [Sphingomonas sp. Leaf412]
MMDLVLPPRCPSCGGVVAAPDRFCTGCWSALRFIGPPWCDGCNVPLDHDAGDAVRCDACLAHPPVLAGVRAAVAYGPVSRTVALKLKYGGRMGLATTAATLMRRHLPDDATLLVPVPLHRWRMWSRGYNQAALMARALGRLADLPDDPHAIVRHRPTRSLRDVARADRRRVLAGAFRATPARVRGRRIVLVDDVYTSGATAAGCVDALLAAEAASVTVLAWARVLDDGVAD